jgi:hypothetical protein
MSRKKEFVTPVRIAQEENGYILDVGFTNCGAPDEKYVFQSFTELVNFLNEHFSFRNDNIFQDMQGQLMITLKTK